MSCLILPRRRFTPPYADVRIDWGNPITQALMYAVIPGPNGPLEVVDPGNSVWSRYGNPRISIGRDGSEIDLSPAINSAYELVADRLPKFGCGTVALAFLQNTLPGAVSSGYFTLTHSDNSSVSPYISLGVKTPPTYTSRIGLATPSQLLESANLLYADRHYSLVGRSRSGYQNLTVVREGTTYPFVYTAYQSVSGTYGTGPRLVVGEDYRLVTRACRSSITLGAIWDRFITDSEVASFIANPWQLFRE